MSDEWEEKLASKKFNVEHALAMEARGSVIMPVRFLYDPERLKEYEQTLACCHIYMIGYLPIVQTDGVGEVDGTHIITKWLIGGKPYEVRTDLCVPGCTVHKEDGENPTWWIVDPEGNPRHPGKLMELAHRQLGDEQSALPFKVLYIGQAFGKNGSRQALDRLLQGHEKLQEICIKGLPEGYALNLLFIDVAPGANLNTIFNPKAKDQNNTYHRILNGLQAQAEMTEAEKITLYEASLIRYFEPQYNKALKEKFPSTNMTILQSCYKKDINSVIAEVNLDADFQLTSDKIPPSKYHVASHELHSDEQRKIFFGLD